MSDEAIVWLRENRCPWCRKRRQAACPYAVERKIGGGWRCRGYKCDDEAGPRFGAARKGNA